VITISVADKIRALLKMKGRTHAELAHSMRVSTQSISNKFYRDSFSSEDLIKAADFLNCELAFNVDEKTKIVLDREDIRYDADRQAQTKEEVS
jgi:transcriptional regulator with XRE-family HTH domain